MVAKGQEWTTLSEGFKRWFQVFAASMNGVARISSTKDYIILECDTSLHGGGGNSNSVWRYDARHLAKYSLIHQLEAMKNR